MIDIVINGFWDIISSSSPMIPVMYHSYVIWRDKQGYAERDEGNADGEECRENRVRCQDRLPCWKFLLLELCIWNHGKQSIFKIVIWYLWLQHCISQIIDIFMQTLSDNSWRYHPSTKVLLDTKYCILYVYKVKMDVSKPHWTSWGTQKGIAC